jgi:MIP family channel proteins
MADADEKMLQKESVVEKMQRRFGLRNELARLFLAEGFGTFILVTLIDASIAQKVLTETKDVIIIKDANGTVTGTFTQFHEGLNTFLGVQLAHFVGILFGIFVCGGISGGHINPAVTLAMAIIGRLEWRKVPAYMAGQFIGAFLACPIIYAIYRNGVTELHARGGSAMGVWATGPYSFTTHGMAIGDQIFGTAILLIVIMAVTDKKNIDVPQSMVPFCVGLAVFAVGLGFGTNAGFCLNPARDFAPRIFETFLYASKPFTRGALTPHYFWIPALVPFVGAVAGALVYLLLIELHHPLPKIRKEFADLATFTT